MNIRTIDTVTIPSSFFFNGSWQDAKWSAQVVDDETGEVLLTALLRFNSEQPVIAAMRLKMQDVAVLRAIAMASTQVRVKTESYDCRTTAQRLEELEAVAAAVNQNTATWVIDVEKVKQRLAVLEAATATILAHCFHCGVHDDPSSNP